MTYTNAIPLLMDTLLPNEMLGCGDWALWQHSWPEWSPMCRASTQYSPTTSGR